MTETSTDTPSACKAVEIARHLRREADALRDKAMILECAAYALAPLASQTTTATERVPVRAWAIRTDTPADVADCLKPFGRGGIAKCEREVGHTGRHRKDSR